MGSAGRIAATARGQRVLTADLVRARRRGSDLVLVALNGAGLERAKTLACELVETAREHVGRTRQELRQALDAVPFVAADKKLKDGLRKLLDDACTFAAESHLDPSQLRSDTFLRASAARSAGTSAGFDRMAILTEVGASHGVDADRIEHALFADLRTAHLLETVAAMSGEELVDRYQTAQAQAVLLRAVSVDVTVSCAEPAAYRELFRQLKFRQLLHTIHRADDGAYRIRIDGPFSLFESVTKYGLRLALMLPIIATCDRFQLVADVRWGKRREPRTFRLQGGTEESASGRDARGRRRPTRSRARSPRTEDSRPGLPDDLARLVTEIDGGRHGWRAQPASTILDLPGIGLCVPDVEFTHEPSGARIYFEQLGFWSRDAVWKRVELVQAGLATPVLFAVSRRLRVSEDVLAESEGGALYVFRSRPIAKEVVARLDSLRLASEPTEGRTDSR